MNIIEALKSGKKCKRRSWKKQWIGPEINDQRGAYLTTEDLLANDWEVEEVQITITYLEFETAWMEAVSKTKTFEGLVQPIEFRRLVAKELGL